MRYRSGNTGCVCQYYLLAYYLASHSLPLPRRLPRDEASSHRTLNRSGAPDQALISIDSQSLKISPRRDHSGVQLADTLIRSVTLSRNGCYCEITLCLRPVCRLHTGWLIQARQSSRHIYRIVWKAMVPCDIRKTKKPRP